MSQSSSSLTWLPWTTTLVHSVFLNVGTTFGCHVIRRHSKPASLFFSDHTLYTALVYVVCTQLMSDTSDRSRSCGRPGAPPSQNSLYSGHIWHRDLHKWNTCSKRSLIVTLVVPTLCQRCVHLYVSLLWHLEVRQYFLLKELQLASNMFISGIWYQEKGVYDYVVIHQIQITNARNSQGLLDGTTALAMLSITKTPPPTVWSTPLLPFSYFVCFASYLK